jgi:hemoglobin
MRPSLYEFARGEAAFLALARAHHERCLADPVLNHPFSHEDQHPQHVERPAAYWGEVLALPRLLRQSARRRRAAGRRGVPRRDARLHARAVDNVLVYSDGQTPVPAGATMPRWGWHGLE